jgi:hypothetical protein
MAIVEGSLIFLPNRCVWIGYSSMFPYSSGLDWVAGAFLLLLLFGKEIEYLLSLCFLGHALKKATVVLNVLTSDEPVHVGLRS